MQWNVPRPKTSPTWLGSTNSSAQNRSMSWPTPHQKTSHLREATDYFRSIWRTRFDQIPTIPCSLWNLGNFMENNGLEGSAVAASFKSGSYVVIYVIDSDWLHVWAISRDRLGSTRGGGVEHTDWEVGDLPFNASPCIFQGDQMIIYEEVFLNFIFKKTKQNST